MARISASGKLDRYFHLDAADRELVDVRRGEHNRLGFAVQLGTVRFLGTFLPNPTDVPELVAVHVAAQLGIADPGVFKGYAQRRFTQWEHAEQIRTSYGYRDFSDPAVQAELPGWLTAHQPAAGRVDDRQRRLHRPGFRPVPPPRLPIQPPPRRPR